MSDEQGYSVDGRKLTFKSGASVSFELPIEHVLDFGEVLVVLLAVPEGTRFSENIFGVGKDGNVRWQVPHIPTRYPYSAFNRIVRLGDVVGTGKVEGLEVQIDPLTGNILKKEFRRF
jgi:hypothetical protein